MILRSTNRTNWKGSVGCRGRGLLFKYHLCHVLYLWEHRQVCQICQSNLPLLEIGPAYSVCHRVVYSAIGLRSGSLQSVIVWFYCRRSCVYYKQPQTFNGNSPLCHFVLLPSCLVIWCFLTPILSRVCQKLAHVPPQQDWLYLILLSVCQVGHLLRMWRITLLTWLEV